MSFSDGLNGWNVVLTVSLVLFLTLVVTKSFRDDLLRRIHEISAKAVAEIIADKERVEGLSSRVDLADSQIAELRARVSRLEHLVDQ